MDGDSPHPDKSHLVSIEVALVTEGLRLLEKKHLYKMSASEHSFFAGFY
jgi:hypothetical protein